MLLLCSYFSGFLELGFAVVMLFLNCDIKRFWVQMVAIKAGAFPIGRPERIPNLRLATGLTHKY
jgi:hypothetical protein